MSETIHVLPVDDLRPHTDSQACKCEPSVRYVEGGMLIVHNAWDGREMLEEENTPKEKRGH